MITDMIAQLRHEKGFAHLWDAGEEIDTRIEQISDDLRFRMIDGIVQLS